MHVGGVESGLQTVADSVMLISESNGILQFPVPLELGHILFTLHSLRCPKSHHRLRSSPVGCIWWPLEAFLVGCDGRHRHSRAKGNELAWVGVSSLEGS
jgi:hypothetical protein